MKNKNMLNSFGGIDPEFIADNGVLAENLEIIKEIEKCYNYCDDLTFKVSCRPLFLWMRNTINIF